MRTRCPNCGHRFRWTLPKCSRCMVRNGNSPLAISGKVLAVVALCAAIWFLAKAFVQTDDTISGVIRATPEKEPSQRQPRLTPPPDRASDPLLRR